MRHTAEQHMKMAQHLHERARNNPDPRLAKKQEAMANVFRLLARRAEKHQRAVPAKTRTADGEQFERPN